MISPRLLLALAWAWLLFMALPVDAGDGKGKGKGNGKGKGSNGDGGPEDICTLLTHHLPASQVHPATSPLYAELGSYWSARQSSRPSCFALPRTTAELSALLRLLTDRGAPFAVKGGGHTTFPGGSGTSLPGSVVVDLSRLNRAVAVSADRATVAVGPGLRWSNVTDVLDPLGLAVVGGRAASVGVAGLLLGGGISYLSGLRGWACDNVRAYEVVLADGRVVRATPRRHEDLYWALRGGGGSAFGVVARFELAAYEQGPLWASRQLFPADAARELIPLMHDLLVARLPADPAAHAWLVVADVPELGGPVVLVDQFHAAHAAPSAAAAAAAAAPPAAFAAFHAEDIRSRAFLTHVRRATVGGLLVDADSPGGSRQTWWTTTVKATGTPALLLDVHALYAAHAERLRGGAAAAGAFVSAGLVLQAISTNVLQAMRVNGGNALGLAPDEGPLMLIQLSAVWADPALDDVVERACRETIRSIDALAAERGARTKNGFVYMNYAGQGQDVLAGYGKANRDRLRKVAHKYDPQGKLDRLWKGYFKP
ncbi:hypothetical protein VTJ83DRAFT_3832 [Remersonia thermophila]|uniref:FAD-binding PCMH-type domain-containing protein n=1 Tax=Remersonia thermophila TaxID=72144 RepID=A0ABR4DGK2_9PEZI